MMLAAQDSRAVERRTFIDFRADSSARKLEGYAATFAAEARIGDFVETIAPGAFAKSLTRDVLALLDHDMGKVLGRTASGTLQLTEDAKGLRFALDLPDTVAGRDVLALAARGDLGGMSFGFTVPQGGDQWDANRRTLRTVDLMEISIVSAWPAYPDTSLALRNRDSDDARARRLRQIKIAEAGQWV